MARTLGLYWRNRRVNLAHANLSYHLKFESTKSSTSESLRDCNGKALNATRTSTKKKVMASKDPSKKSNRLSQRSPSKLLVLWPRYKACNIQFVFTSIDGKVENGQSRSPVRSPFRYEAWGLVDLTDDVLYHCPPSSWLIVLSEEPKRFMHKRRLTCYDSHSRQCWGQLKVEVRATQGDNRPEMMANQGLEDEGKMGEGRAKQNCRLTERTDCNWWRDKSLSLEWQVLTKWYNQIWKYF